MFLPSRQWNHQPPKPRRTTLHHKVLSLSNRQQRKLKKSQTFHVSCSLQDMMQQSQQPDETGSGARSGAGALQSTARPPPPSMNKEMYATPTRNDQPSSGTTPNSMPTTIKVNKSEESQMSSSIPGLGSSMDMSMNIMTEEQEIALVKLCVNTKMFPFWKFYNRDGDGQFTCNEKKMCGFLICNTPETKTPKNEEWWLRMRTHVVKALTDHRKNVIKSCMNKLKAK